MSAQGCAARATLGQRPQHFLNPEAVGAGARPPVHPQFPRCNPSQFLTGFTGFQNFRIFDAGSTYCGVARDREPLAPCGELLDKRLHRLGPPPKSCHAPQLVLYCPIKVFANERGLTPIEDIVRLAQNIRPSCHHKPLVVSPSHDPSFRRL